MKSTDKSIRKQFAIIFGGLLAGTIVLCIIANSLFVRNYYQGTKQKVVINAYDTINNLSIVYNSDYSSEDFSKTFKQICDTYNLNVIIVDPSLNILKSSSKEDGSIVMRLLSYIFKDNPNFTFENIALPQASDGKKTKERPLMDRIVKTTDNYSVHVSADPVMDLDYIELWGTLEDGNMILVRSSVQSIRENAAVSNRFFVLIGIVAIGIGAMLIWVITKRITDPILELSDISKRMASLDFDAKYSGKDENEIGILGEHINKLSNALEETISELKTANNELKVDLEKKEAIDSMRREFLSNVSHELKTPIALIQGYAEGLKDGITQDPESADFYCDVIIDEAAKMNKMVKNLLTLNQIEFGVDAVEFTRFDLTALIKNYLHSVDILIENADAKVIYECDEEIFVWADDFKTEEVFANYFTNALNHLGGNREVRISLKKSEDTVRVSVFNTGDCIAEENIDKLWDKFYKIDKARSREYGGSGIGLSIVKAIMESFHQKYGVINHSDGVEFYFELDCKHN